jgi:hypothetical protein
MRLIIGLAEREIQQQAAVGRGATLDLHGVVLVAAVGRVRQGSVG